MFLSVFSVVLKLGSTVLLGSANQFFETVNYGTFQKNQNDAEEKKL